MTNTKMDIHHLKLMFENSTDFVFFMRKSDDDYVYEYINPSEKATVPNIEVSKFFSQVMERKIAETILKYYNRAIETGQQTQFQDYTKFTSDIRKYESTIYPIFIEDDSYVLVITRLISFDRNIEDKYLFMRSVFFKTFLSTVLISSDYQLLEANPSFLSDFGINIDDVRGKNFVEIGIMEQKHARKYLTYLQQAIAGKSVSAKHVQFKDRLGQVRHFICSLSPLIDDENEVIALFLILQETTEFVRQKRELKTVAHSMDILKRAFDSTADISVTDTTGRIIDVNEKFMQRSGYTRAELVGNTHHLLNSGFHPTEFFRDLWQTISGGEIWRGEVCNKSKQGVTYWNEATIIPLRDIQGNIHQYLGIYFNVSHKKKLMTELRTIERTFRLITENTNDLIVIFNGKGIITYASPSYIRLFGIEEDHLIGMSYERLLTPASQLEWRKIITVDSTNQDVAELELLLPTGEMIWTECHYKTSIDARQRDKSETTMVSRIITERKQYENQLVFMAYHDSLTHLPNRRFLAKEFPHLMELANAQFKSIAVFYVDGDNFKNINDTYGHDVGDEFICNFGQILARNVNANDIVVRMGGDEFIIILTGLSRDEKKCMAEIDAFFRRLQFDLKIGWQSNGISFHPTATMGVTIYPEHFKTLDELIDAADQMLYEAKAVGRNRYKIYSNK
ncbi:MAG: diguanylate cyclase [Lysinibacillus sp.]